MLWLQAVIHQIHAVQESRDKTILLNQLSTKKVISNT